MPTVAEEKSFMDLSIGGEHNYMHKILGANMPLLASLPGGVITLEQWNGFVEWAVEKAYVNKWDDGYVPRATLYGMWMRSLQEFIKVGKVDVSKILPREPKSLRP